jgi:putative protein kinase ArgK-like GTPase of G3E family
MKAKKEKQRAQLNALRSQTIHSQEENIKSEIFTHIRSRNMFGIQELLQNIDQIHQKESHTSKDEVTETHIALRLP